MTQVNWHPYPDGIPEQKGEYLVSYKYLGKGESIVSFGCWDPNEHWDIFGDDEVIAWAEFPEPYEPPVKTFDRHD